MKDKLTGKINNETLTRGIFYCRDSAEIKVCGSLQILSWLDSVVLRSRQQKHTAIRQTAQKHQRMFLRDKNSII